MTIPLTTTFIYVTSLNLLSIVFLIVSLRKLRNILRLLTLEESHYTLLFGWIGARTLANFYILTILGLSAFLWFVTA